jgi:hypothetical protein
MKASGAIVDRQAIRLLQRKGIIRSVAVLRQSYRSVGNEKVDITIEVDVDPSHSESSVGEAGQGDATLGRSIGKELTIPLVERVGFTREMGQDEIAVTVTVDIGETCSHTRLGLPPAIDGETPESNIAPCTQ